MEELQHISGRLTTRVAASNEKTPGPASREKLCKLCSDLRKPTNERFIFLGGGFSFRDLYFQPLVGKNDPTDFKFPSRRVVGSLEGCWIIGGLLDHWRVATWAWPCETCQLLFETWMTVPHTQGQRVPFSLGFTLTLRWWALAQGEPLEIKRIPTHLGRCATLWFPFPEL